jgi:sulfatase modifying factor 1
VNLPTEAQWEYSCRAGTATRFYSGDDDAQLASIAWFKGNSGDGTRTVSGRNANAWGIYDMSGNVYEWCRDWYSPVYASGPVNDPEETRSNLSDKPRRVLRGGSFLKDAKACRSAARWRNDARSRNADNGFRIVASINASPVTAPVAPPIQLQPIESPNPATTFNPPPVQPYSSPSRIAPQHSQYSAMAGIAIVFGVGLAGLIITLIVYKIILAASRSRGPAFNNVRPRAAADGFFLDGASRGSVVRYRYRNGDSWQDGSYTVIDPGPQGMFVYTGHRPSDIEILDIVSGGSSYTSHPSSPVHTTSSSSSSSFSGYPSAY